MIDLLIRELGKSNYTGLNTDNQYTSLFYQVKDDGIYIVSLFECVNNMDTFYEEFIEGYYNNISMVKWGFINQGYRNINVLHVVISEDISLARKFIKDFDTYWIVNSNTNRLVIFENQKANFLGVKEMIEQVLDSRDNNVTWESKLNLLSNLIANLSPKVITCFIVFINTILFVIMDWTYDWNTYNTFIEQGGISYNVIANDHQYYRFLTHMFIHADMNHLFGNMIVLFFIGSLAEEKLGKFRYIILYFFGGLVAAFTSLGYNRVQDSSILSIGASGAIFAVVGAIIAIVIFNKREFEEIGIKRLLFFVVLTLINGFNSQGIDNAAHVGGLLAGLVLGQVLYLGASKKKQKKLV